MYIINRIFDIRLFVLNFEDWTTDWWSETQKTLRYQVLRKSDHLKRISIRDMKVDGLKKCVKIRHTLSEYFLFSRSNFLQFCVRMYFVALYFLARWKSNILRAPYHGVRQTLRTEVRENNIHNYWILFAYFRFLDYSIWDEFSEIRFLWPC